jgi:predicted dehydrogenase
MEQLRMAVIGTGMIGQKHIQTILDEPRCRLAALVDPAPEARVQGEKLGVPVFADHQQMLREMRPDGVINATPNKLHVPVALDCVAAGVPSLVEKPVAESIEAAGVLARAVAQGGVPVLVGHHRRHNPIIRAAREIIDSGRLGRIVTVSALFALYKADDYFAIDWHRKQGAGPLLTNLIHDLDLMRYLVGEIELVQAISSNAVRGLEIEDSAVLSMRFASGALGTATVSDTVAAPWSWELTSQENTFYPTQPENCYFITGTRASLAIPKLEVWYYDGAPGWGNVLQREQVAVTLADPFVHQLRHFCDVIEGKSAPIVTVDDAIGSLSVIQAVKRAAASGLAVSINET